MGLQLPGGLVMFLQMIGYNWPEADEEKLFEMGQRWTNFSGSLSEVGGSTDGTASQVWSQNTGDDIAAFANHWGHDDGPSNVLAQGSTAATLIGTGMTVISAIVLALKVQVIVQLVILAAEIAQALASAVVTFGASLAEIPVFQQLTQKVVGMLVDQVIAQLVNA